MQRIQEREKLRQEVIAEFQASANNYVAEQISQRQLQMEQEFKRRVQEEAIKNAMKYPLIPQFTSNVVAGKGNGLQFPPGQTKIYFGESENDMEVSNDQSMQLPEGENNPLASAKTSAQQRRRNQQLGHNFTNTIRNVSEEPAF